MQFDSKIPILTTRFNNYTWNENCEYRMKHNIECIYASTRKIKEKILLNDYVFVIEMNNSKNKIEGIGLIKNFVHFDKYYKVYDDKNYDIYVYKSKYRIDRCEIDPYLLKIIDHLLFKEKTHSKRGTGFTSFPEKLLIHPICRDYNLKEKICDLFNRKFNYELYNKNKGNILDNA
jgi:hypothetical protein